MTFPPGAEDIFKWLDKPLLIAVAEVQSASDPSRQSYDDPLVVAHNIGSPDTQRVEVIRAQGASAPDDTPASLPPFKLGNDTSDVE